MQRSRWWWISMVMLAALMVATGRGYLIYAQEEPPAPPVVEEPTPPAEEPAPPGEEPPPGDDPAAAVEGSIGPRAPQTSCQMTLNDAGDSDPFTYDFAAVYSPDIVSFQWDLGDGTNVSTPTASHRYTVTGTFPLILTCTPASGPDLILTGEISITNVPVASFLVTPGMSGVAPHGISTVNTSSGGGLSYLWEVFGPEAHASQTSANASYTFTTPGNYLIRLTVTDGVITAIAEENVTVNAPQPLADFSLSPSSGPSPLTVTLQGVDLGAGPITGWTWDFGDGTFASGQGPHTVIYNAQGTYTITMTYSGPGGGGSASKQVGVYASGSGVIVGFTWRLTGRDVGAGIEVCFTNTSTGPIITNVWNFGDGTPAVTDNSAEVCHIYATGGSRVVQLTVSTASATSNGSQTINVVGAPVAHFTASSNSIVWGDTVNFDSTASTGTITAWAWDFNGDGVTDSTEQNPQNVSLTSLGSNPIRLTVTGPGGSSSAEMLIFVARLEITCDFSGSLSVLPGAGAQTYTSAIGSAGGRAISYNWTITGPNLAAPQTFTTPNISMDWSLPGFGTYQIRLDASTLDGSSCTKTKTVSYAWRPLNCQMSSSLPATLYADGSTIRFNALVSSLDGRAATYRWYVDNVLQAGQTGPTFDWTNTTSTVGLPRAFSVRYEVEADNGAGYTPATAGCEETTSFSVQPWPTLTCNNIGGQGGPQPGTPDDPTRSYTYSANVSGTAGLPVSYNWTASGGTVNTPNPRPDNNQASVTWNATAGSFPPAAADDSIGVTVTVTYPDSTTASCSMSRNIAVTINRLMCNTPTGDLSPVVGETVQYGRSVTNTYGRPWAAVTPLVWEIEEWDAVNGVWVPLPGGTSNPFAVTFPTANSTYRIRYSAAVDAAGGLPADSCTLTPWQPINVAGSGQNFFCDGASVTGNLNPTNPAGSYRYSVDIDNGNVLNLTLRWVLVDSTGFERELATTTSSLDGVIDSPNFSGTTLAPLGVDHYTLRVDVSAPGQSSYTCSRQADLIVGTLTVNYTYTGNASAIEVGQPICLTNTSFTSHGDINALTYTWDFDTAANSLGAATSTAVQPGCISFNQAGQYDITLTGRNGSGLMSASRTVTFQVYNSQSILLDRSNTIYAPDTVSFTATGANITSAYTWRFFDAGGGQIGQISNAGANVNRYFNTPGRYRVQVSGSGPLGVTSAELEFELLGVNDIRAAFIPSIYGGIAPMQVCFDDNSLGNNITGGTWDFGNGQTLPYTPGGQPCVDYTTPGQEFLVRLTIQNASGLTAEATNVVRAYSLLESGQSFSITPMGGARYCFSANLQPGVSIVSWNFGDTQVAGAQSPVCHTFQSAGIYLVTMRISDGVQNGTIVRPVTVTAGGGPAPQLSASGVCGPDRTASFEVSNTGGDMASADQLVIRDRHGVAVLIQPLLLRAGDRQTFTVSDQSGTVRLNTVDSGVTASTDCEYPPAITVTGMCTAGGAAFMVANGDGPMVAPQSYTVTNGVGVVIAASDFQLARGAAPLIIAMPAPALDERFTFTSTGTVGGFTVAHLCPAPLAAAATPEPDTDSLGGLAAALVGMGGASDRDTLRFNGLSADLLGLAPWADQPTCGHGCPTWRVYHSNDTGDWEIFRLDGAGDDHTLRTNLSHGPAAEDMSPSRSPNGAWIIFTSNRDTEPGEPENWELYVAPTSGDARLVERVTFNTIAYDTNPVWGPGNFVVFQTTRHGNWDLYLLDMATGREYRLTESGADDINPNWSPDGSRIVFQSDRDGDRWQIYEINLLNLTQTRLSDGLSTDVDPQYAPDGSRIAFRSYASAGADSLITLMNADGSGRLPVTALDGDATNQAWSPSGRLIAYQSLRNGQLDIYVYDTATGATRQLTDSAIPDYAPTWLCGDDMVVFTSDESGSPDIWQAPALPIETGSIRVPTDADRLTFEPGDDIYPQNMPPKEFASREGQTILGIFGQQTVFLLPDPNVTPVDLAVEGVIRRDWRKKEACDGG